MGLADADGSQRRIDQARTVLSDRLLPALSSRFHTDVLQFGERLSPVEVGALSATPRPTALAAGLQGARAGCRGRPVAGMVALSDGGDNGSGDAAAPAAAGAPIYAIG